MGSSRSHIDGWSEIGRQQPIYGDNEVVTLWVNTIGPFHNPLRHMRTMIAIPLSRNGIERAHRPAGIGETEGYELRNSGLKMHLLKLSKTRRFGDGIERRNSETIP